MDEVFSAKFEVNNNLPPGLCRDMLPKAVFKREAVDFQVDENLGFEPDGAGEHLWLQIRKTACNTRDVIEALAAGLKAPVKDTGCAGLKDKHAITTQWISVPYPIAMGMPEESELFGDLPGIEVLCMTRSAKKLRRGAHRANHFTVRLREIEAGQEGIDSRLKQISQSGFPNFFGVQRFGIDGSNVDNARSMFTRKRKLTRFKRSMYLSAARSWLFNQVLTARIEAGNWQTVESGDVCMLNGSNSIFQCDQTDAELQQRHDEHDIHVTGPLHGRGQPLVSGGVLAFESECLASDQLLCDGLEQAGLKVERRALRALAHDLKWCWQDSSTLELSFSLQRGVYATSLLSEIVQLQERMR